MARYFFDLEDGGGVTLDREGLDFADLRQAAEEAFRFLTDLAKDTLPLGDRCDIRLKVRDGDGHYRCVVALSLAAKWIA